MCRIKWSDRENSTNPAEPTRLSYAGGAQVPCHGAAKHKFLSMPMPRAVISGGKSEENVLFTCLNECINSGGYETLVFH